MIRQLRADHTCAEIAHKLNRDGYLSKRGKKFTKSNIVRLCDVYNIQPVSPEILHARKAATLADGRISLGEAASLLNMNLSTVRYLCVKGDLNAIKSAAGSNWRVLLSSDDIKRMKKRAA
jgi:hypothetical protein